MILVSEDEMYEIKNILENEKNEKNFIISCVERDFLFIKIIEFLNII